MSEAIKTSEIVVSQINKRLDNQDKRINSRLEGIEEKLSGHGEKLASIDGKLDKNNEILDMHIRRTEANERQITEFRKFQDETRLELKAFQGRIYGALVVISGLVPFILFFLNKLMK